MKELVWTIASIWVLQADVVLLTGEFPNQKACIKAVIGSEAGRELPPDVRQCVQIEKQKLHEYAQAGL
jgi:hypothetical protein